MSSGAVLALPAWCRGGARLEADVQAGAVIRPAGGGRSASHPSRATTQTFERSDIINAIGFSDQVFKLIADSLRVSLKK